MIPTRTLRARAPAGVYHFADFKTGQGTGRAAEMNFKGVFTRDRRPKMAAHFLRSRWAGR